MLKTRKTAFKICFKQEILACVATQKIQLEKNSSLEMLGRWAISRRRRECFNVFKIPIGIGILQFGFQVTDKLPNLEFAQG